MNIQMDHIRAAAILAIDNRFRTPRLELKCLETSFGGAKQKFSIPWDGRRVIKAGDTRFKICANVAAVVQQMLNSVPSHVESWNMPLIQHVERC